MLNIVYLHGFASSPSSQKAQYLGERLIALGGGQVNYRVPDLNTPCFERLTLTAILRRIASEVSFCPQGPVYLIGSSLGGLAALHYLDRYQNKGLKRVEKVVFLAPAFHFIEYRQGKLGAQWLEEWQQVGMKAFYHYGYDDVRLVHYGLVQDLFNYNSHAASLSIPAQIYHGRNDASVPYSHSEQFVTMHPSATLHLLDSDHQLLDQTETILNGICEFIGLESKAT